MQKILAGSEWDADERVITKLYTHSVYGDISKTIYCFCNKFKSFQNHTDIHSKINFCNSLEITNGNYFR